MGGSGGGFIPSSSPSLKKKIEQAREEERQRLDGDVNRYLQKLLVTFNDRDIDATRSRLEELVEQLGAGVEVEQFLLGGSVAKHTYVDGLSDVDALVVLDRSDLAGKSPRVLLGEFYKTLRSCLDSSAVESVDRGSLAVTVKYRDGIEIQLLPALRAGNKVSIADSTGTRWKETKPKEFQKALTSANDRLNSCLVPTIKLVKAIVSEFPKQKQISGYHVESLALDAAKGYRGLKTPRALVAHILDHAATRVLKPIRDATGQSRLVDAGLGKANSIQRRNVAMALASVKRRLDAATSISQWKALFEG